MNANPATKIKYGKKMLAVAVNAIVVVALVASWQIYELTSNSKPKISLPNLTLTLVGAGGQQKTLNSNELGALKSITASGGYSQEGKTYVGNFTGVPLLTLLNLVGGITSSDNVTVTGSDGYQITFTYQQVQGLNLTTIDPATGSAVQPTQPLTVIVAYYCNCTSLTSDKGPLSIALVGPQGFLTDGGYWTYFLVKIEIKS